LRSWIGGIAERPQWSDQRADGERARDNHRLTTTTQGCHPDLMNERRPTPEETIERIKVVRAEAVEHTRQARRLAVERRDLMQSLIDRGWSQSDVARQLGVTRQAIQKMLSL
jgi:transcriptional regulator with GAF, ATPase, and Fis domain